MKRIKFLVIAAFLCGFVWSNAFAKEASNYQNFELDTLLHDIDEPQAPIVTENYIIFTSDVTYRSVGIAFDFENYQVIHPFQLLTSTEVEEGKKKKDTVVTVTRKHLFYCYPREHLYTSIKYRLIIDGLWTTDPLNPQKEYDESVNLYFSKLDLPGSIKILTEQKEDNTVHFIYKGEKGLQLRLAGTFTNWDSWIYELEEVSPGLYELDLPLTTGTYYYNYYIGLTPILDNTNPIKAYTRDGRSASVITVN